MKGVPVKTLQNYNYNCFSLNWPEIVFDQRCENFGKKHEHELSWDLGGSPGKSVFIGCLAVLTG